MGPGGSGQKNLFFQRETNEAVMEREAKIRDPVNLKTDVETS